MQFDFFDKKIKEAAENHHPAYNEKAWTRMEKLLEKHLPEKKDDRRRFFFFLLLFFLLLGGGISYLLIDKPWKNNSTLAEKSEKSQKTLPGIPSETPLQKNEKANTLTTTENKLPENQTASVNPGNKQSTEKITENNSTQENTSAQQLPGNEKPRSVPVNKNLQSKRFNSTGKEGIVSSREQKNNEIISPPSNKDQQSSVSNKADVTMKDQPETKPLTEETPVKKEEQKIVTEKNIAENKVDEISKKDEANNETIKNVQPQKKNKANNKKESPFAFSISVGPDVSKAGSSSVGKVNFNYGIGISYSFKKFTLRSGFYIASKVYGAEAKDYKLEYTLPSYIKLLHVDADCKVYEIPVSVAYNFGKRENSNWYAAAGLSSYLMKEEKYNNLYKNTNTNQDYYRSFSYNNRNKHYFSVLDLSAGYTYRLNKTVSFSAEPYLKIPLQGIGQGKVNLNSAGVMFSVGIKPFKAKSK